MHSTVVFRGRNIFLLLKAPNRSLEVQFSKNHWKSSFQGFLRHLPSFFPAICPKLKNQLLAVYWVVRLEYIGYQEKSSSRSGHRFYSQNSTQVLEALNGFLASDVRIKLESKEMVVPGSFMGLSIFSWDCNISQSLETSTGVLRYNS